MHLTAQLAALALGVTAIGSTRAEAQLTCLKPTAGAESVVAVFLSDDATKRERERLGIKVQDMKELRPLTDAADAPLCRKLDLAVAALPAYYFRTGPYVIGTNDAAPRVDGPDPTVYVFESLGREIPPVCPARFSDHCNASPRPCWPPDYMSEAVVDLGVGVLTDTTTYGQRFRTQYGIPAGTAADVALVRDDAVCDAAAAGMERAGVFPPQTRASIVVRLGRSSPFYLLAEHNLRGLSSIRLLSNKFTYLTLFGYETYPSDGPP